MVKVLRMCGYSNMRNHIKRYALVLTACAVLAALLEFGTLVGAPMLTPINPDHWRLKRIAVFFCFLLAVYAFWRITSDEERRRFVHLVRSWWSGARISTRFLGVVGLLVAAVILLAVFPSAASRVVGDGYDFRFQVIAIFIVLTAGLLLIFREKIAKKLEWGFLVISLSFGTLMCVCMPVIAEISWDGQIHFNNATAVSYVLDAEYSGSDQLMTKADAVIILDLLESGDIAGVWNPTQDAESVMAANEEMLRLDESGFEAVVGARRFGGASWISAASIGYLPLAVGLWTGRLFQLDCLGRYFLARIFSVAFYSVVFFLAIRRLRSGKTIVAALGLLPTSMLMAANFSYDPWCYALITYSFARYVGVLQSGSSFRRCDSWAIYGCFFLGALVKAVLFPLLLVFFLAPKRSFSSRRSEARFRVCAVLVVLALLSSFAIPFIASGASGGDTRGGSDVSSAGQVAFILADPIRYLGILIGFCIDFFDPRQAASILNTFGGFPYLCSDSARAFYTAVAEWIIILFTVLLDRSQCDKPYRGSVTKAACLIGATSAFALVATALYVSFTPVGSPTIAGVQYRYLLPFLAATFLVFANFWNGPLSDETRSTYSKVFLAAEWLIMVFVTATLFVIKF